jgi:hypothetical protein
MNPIQNIKPLRHALVLSALFVGACNAGKVWEPIEGWDQPACGDMGTKPGADLAMPTKKALCKAAEGLPGGDDPASAVICVDFTTAGLTIDALKQQGWSFDDRSGCKWAIQSGRLVNMDLASLVGSCQITLPLKSLTAQQNRVTIAVVQRGEIGSNMQATLYLTSAARRPLLSFSDTINNRIIVDIDRTDSRIINNQLLPIIYSEKVGSSAPTGPGWQIESVAVIGTP